MRRAAGPRFQTILLPRPATGPLLRQTLGKDMKRNGITNQEATVEQRAVRQSALHVGRQLVLGTALATSAFMGGYRGYVRRAYAACVPVGGHLHLQRTADHDADAHRRPADGDDGPWFQHQTATGNAFTLTGTGGLTFTDLNQSAITGADTGIEAETTAAPLPPLQAAHYRSLLPGPS